MSLLSDTLTLTSDVIENLKFCWNWTEIEPGDCVSDRRKAGRVNLLFNSSWMFGPKMCRLITSNLKAFPGVAMAGSKVAHAQYESINRYYAS